MKLRTTAKKQLSIVERYVDVESANVYEHFLASLKQLFNAESLCTYILNTLDTFKLTQTTYRGLENYRENITNKNGLAKGHKKLYNKNLN